MVKPLADILSEIEERNSILGFRPGGDVDDTPADPGQDDTLGEEDEGTPTDEDWGGLEEATIDTHGPITTQEKYDAIKHDIDARNRVEDEVAFHEAMQAKGISTPEIVENLEQLDQGIFSLPNSPAEWGLQGLKSGISSALGITPLTLGFSAINALITAYQNKQFEDTIEKQRQERLNPTNPTSLMTPTIGRVNLTNPQAIANVVATNPERAAALAEGVSLTDYLGIDTGIPDPMPNGGGGSGDDWIPPISKPTQVVAANMLEEAVAQPSLGKGWSLDPDTWYTSAAQGGAIDAFSPGGLAGMMMPTKPPQFRGLFEPRRPPMQPPQRPKLDAETYFHTHEGGKVEYPNFPQPFINKEDSPNPFKGGGFKPPLPPARPAIPFQPYPPQAEVDEAIISQMNAVEQQPIPPVSISETTATAMQPEEVQETQTTTIEEAPVPREIDIQMPENITATLDFPEQVTGTATYARGGDIPTDEQMKIDDEIVRRQRRTRELLKQIEKMDADMDRNTRILEKLGLIPKRPKPVGIDQEEFYKQEDYLDRLRRLPKEQHKQLKKMPVTTAQGGEIPETYARGGLAGILKALAPMGAGFLLGPMGHIPAMLAGAGTQYALAGKKRSFLDAIKGGLSGYAGSGISRLGTATVDAASPTKAGDISKIGKTFTPAGATDKTTYLADAYAKAGPGSGYILNPNITSFPQYGDALAKSGKGLWEGLRSLEPATYKALVSEGAGPLAAMVGQTAITTPAEMPEMTEIEVAQVQSMTPEERRKYIEDKRRQYADNPLMQPTVFAPPNVDIGFEVTTAADGGVMEIDEEMESGSFVLPADVVSNVGDGSSTSGHRRLTDLFEMSEEEYAMGGGILKGPIKGPGGGLDDLIQTGIDGVRVARLSSDEFVVPKDVVRRLGNGSQKAGAEKLYDFMKDVRLKKHGTPDQPKEMHMSGLRKMV